MRFYPNAPGLAPKRLGIAEMTGTMVQQNDTEPPHALLILKADPKEPPPPPNLLRACFGDLRSAFLLTVGFLPRPVASADTRGLQSNFFLF